MIARSYRRVPASLPGTLVMYDGPHVVRSVDLSRNGCRIRNNVRVAPGMVIDLLIFPPGEDSPILIHEAMVRWSGDEGIGIEFQAVSLHHQDRLDLLIKNLQKVH
ncbi:MAG TPA: PilZ domain-containing protein [Nitrospira sp.]|nr:PilZ domain-containing protein [Nitrospira sp.]